MNSEGTLGWAAKVGLIGLLLLGLGTGLTLLLGQLNDLALHDLSKTFTTAFDGLKSLRRPAVPSWMPEVLSLAGGVSLLGLILSLYLKQFRSASFSKPGRVWLLAAVVMLEPPRLALPYRRNETVGERQAMPKPVVKLY